MFDFSEAINRIDKKHDKMYEEVNRLMADPPKEMPIVGDRVIVAIGLLSRGHLWLKAEAVVKEVGENSVKVECDQYQDKQPWTEWIHPALITDNLKASKKL